MFSLNHSGVQKFFEADKGKGGSAAPTIAELIQKVATLEGEKAQFSNDLQTARESLAQMTKRAESAEQKASAAEQLAADLQTKLTALESEVTKLKADAKNAADRAREIAAASGVNPTQKASDVVKQQKSGVELWQTYQAADPAEKARMRAKHGDELAKAAAEYDAEKNNR